MGKGVGVGSRTEQHGFEQEALHPTASALALVFGLMKHRK